eukprot:COSAG06_NODE_624_length_13686_cov_86.804666_16_plen_120_part_00
MPSLNSWPGLAPRNCCDLCTINALLLPPVARGSGWAVPGAAATGVAAAAAAAPGAVGTVATVCCRGVRGVLELVFLWRFAGGGDRASTSSSTATTAACKKTHHLFLSFPYVWPERVLAK